MSLDAPLKVRAFFHRVACGIDHSSRMAVSPAYKWSMETHSLSCPAYHTSLL